MAEPARASSSSSPHEPHEPDAPDAPDAADASRASGPGAPSPARHRGAERGWLGTVFRWQARLEEALLAWSMIAIAILTIANVAARSLFGVSLAFAEELTQFLIIAVTFVGLSYAAGKGRHIRMSALFDQLPRRARRRLMAVIAGTTAALLVLLTVHAVSYLATVKALGTLSPVLHVPYHLVYLSAPIGLSLAAVQFALAAVQNLRSDEVHLSFTHRDAYVEAQT